MKKLYVGCALAKAPDWFVMEVTDFKNKLRTEFEILDFLGKVRGTPTQVFQADMGQLAQAEKMLAICDFPSLGLGYEIATALSLEIPVLAVAQKEISISRLIQGIENSNFSFCRYGNMEDLFHIATELL